MKKVLLVSMLMGSLLIGACQKKAEPNVTSGESVTETSESITVDETTEDETSADAASGNVDGTTVGEEEQKVSGVVEDAAMNSFVIKLEDGSTLELNKDDDTEVVSSKELAVDDKVEVTYEGDTVKKIVVVE